ncbi:MAG: hypothetical protein ACP5GJ_03825 [Nanopusillaceae archaeon]
MVSILDRISAKETLVLFIASAVAVFVVAAIISMFGISQTLGLVVLALAGIVVGFVLAKYAPQTAEYLKTQPITAILVVAVLLGVAGFVAAFLSFMPAPYATIGTIAVSTTAVQSAIGNGINNFITMGISGFVMGVGSWFGVAFSKK